jgi:hypothetical protein
MKKDFKRSSENYPRLTGITKKATQKAADNQHQLQFYTFRDTLYKVAPFRHSREKPKAQTTQQEMSDVMLNFKLSNLTCGYRGLL